MRIVLEPGSYSLQNVGDVAMLQVAARRLRVLWPNASIGVVTEAPQQLPSVCPGTEPIMATRDLVSRRTPRSLRTAPRLLRHAVWQRFAGSKHLPGKSVELDDFAATVRSADLVVVSGMGSLNDCFLARASRVLGTLELAHKYDVPAALLSQGLGPLQDPVFKQKVAQALTNVGLIALRERLSGPVLLEQMGVSRDIVRITGDDAIELAYDARPDRSGSCLGINVRVADYAGVDDATIATVRSVLRDAAARLQTQVLPIPISHRHSGLDVKANRALLRDIDPTSDGGASLLTPLDVVHQVGRCRLVIAGSYHAAVFALAQGIPAVALVNSPYYADKFLGLADMFGSGCEIVRVSDRRFPETLADAVYRGWASAQQCRPRLLAAAADQVELGYRTYQDLLPLATERTLRVGPQVRRAN